MVCLLGMLSSNLPKLRQFNSIFMPSPTGLPGEVLLPLSPLVITWQNPWLDFHPDQKWSASFACPASYGSMVPFQCYADDTQLYISTKFVTISTCSIITNCLKDIKTWMNTSFLKLHSNKSYWCSSLLYGIPFKILRIIIFIIYVHTHTLAWENTSPQP